MAVSWSCSQMESRNLLAPAPPRASSASLCCPQAREWPISRSSQRPAVRWVSLCKLPIGLRMGVLLSQGQRSGTLPWQKGPGKVLWSALMLGYGGPRHEVVFSSAGPLDCFRTELGLAGFRSRSPMLLSTPACARLRTRSSPHLLLQSLPTSPRVVLCLLL